MIKTQLGEKQQLCISRILLHVNKSPKKEETMVLAQCVPQLRQLQMVPANTAGIKQDVKSPSIPLSSEC